MSHQYPLVEICVEGIDGLLAAQAAGADRVELCAALIEGGLTPSIGTVKHGLGLATIPFHVIVRPRGGDFLYSEAEFQSMLDDVEALRQLGVAGVVVGCLTAGGDIDEPRMTALVERAGPLNVTCHRAFDMTRDPFAALEALVRCGVGRVLTSGQRDTAIDGLKLLTELVDRAGDAENVGEIVRQTGLREIHFAALADLPSEMRYRNPQVGMGGTEIDREYRNTVTDGAKVEATIAAARAAHGVMNQLQR